MRLIQLIFNLSTCFILSGCLYGQCMNGACSLERAEIIKTIKTYGEFWTKPDMTKESWRADWVGCGGMSTGHFAGGAPERSSTQVIREYIEKERIKLDACMKSKGYEFRYVGYNAPLKK